MGCTNHRTRCVCQYCRWFKITETGSDLAVLLACASSLRTKALPQQLAVFGEVGLSGEIRPVPNGQERLKKQQNMALNTSSYQEVMPRKKQFRAYK